MMTSVRASLIGLTLFLASALAADYTGKVVSIADGDTFTLLTPEKRQIKVRLAEIDTPERGQPYANKARQALSQLVFGKQVTVVPVTTDRYGRTVGRVYVDSLDVNAEMVRGGHAWVYRKYATDQSFYDFEKQDRQQRLGIWALPESQQVPPWEWRARRR